MSHFRAHHFNAGHFAARHFRPPTVAGVSARPSHFGSQHFAARHFNAAHFGTVALTYLRPDEDTSPGSWKASDGGPLYEAINESERDSSDFIYTESFTSSCVIKLTSISAFSPEDAFTFSYSLQGNRGMRIWVSLMAGVGGVSPVATWEHYPAPEVDTVFVRELNSYQKLLLGRYGATDVYLKVDTEWAG